MFKSLKDKTIRLLRWSEKYTKADMMYVVSRNFWVNVNRGSGVINGIILSIAFALFLSKEAYGTYAFALAVIGVFSMPPTSALGAGIVRGVAHGSNRIIFEGMRRVFPWSLGASVLLGILGLYYGFMDNAVLMWCFLAGAVVLPISVSNSIAKSFLSSKGDFKLLARFTLWRTPLMTAVLVLVAWSTRSALFIVVTNIIGNVLLGILLYVTIRRTYSFNEQLEPTEPFAGRYAFHSGVLSIFSYLSEKIDNLLLWKFAGAAPVAIYLYATSPVRELRGLIENQSTIALPKFAQKSLEEVKSNLLLRIRQLYLIAIPLTLGYIIAAPYIFHLLFPQYIDAISLSQLAALSILATPRKLISAAITAQQRVRESYIMIVLPNIIRIALAVIFVPLFGIKGAVIALLVAELIDFGILGLMIKSLRNVVVQQDQIDIPH